MKKYFLAFLVVIIIMIASTVLSKYVLAFTIPDFLVGWFCCTGFMLTLFDVKL